MSGKLTQRKDSALSLTITKQLVDEWLEHERTVNEVSGSTIDAYHKGLDVFVQEVIAAMTILPSQSLNGCPFTTNSQTFFLGVQACGRVERLPDSS